MKKKSLRFGWHNRTFNICLSIVGAILLAYIVYNSLALSRNMKSMDHARQEFQDYSRAKDRMRTGSDNLTECVRRYVTTGDVRFRNEFFRELHESKNREFGLNLLERPSGDDTAGWLGWSEREIRERKKNVEAIKQDFHKAKKYSDDLMEQMEFKAMRLVATDAELADPDYPQELRNARVSPGDLDPQLLKDAKVSVEDLDPELLKDPESIDKAYRARKRVAIRMLFGEDYAKSKQDIYNALDNSLTGAAKLADSRRRDATVRQHNLWINQIVSMALFVLVFLTLLVWSGRIFSRRTAFLQQMLDAIPLLIFLKDRRTRCYVDYNRTYADFLHRSGIEDTKGKTDHDIMVSEAANLLEANDEEALSRDEPSVYYESMPGLMGRTRYFRSTKLGITDPEGNPCLLGMALDMTDEHERQLNSEAAEEALLTLQQEPILSTPFKILEIIRRRLNADYCYIARCREEESFISIEPEAFVIRGGGNLPKRISSRIGAVKEQIDRVRLLGFCTFSEEESARIRKFFNIDRTAEDTPRAVIHFATRLTVQGGFWGLLSVAYVNHRELSDPEKSFLQKIARIIESSIERTLVYDALAKAKNEAICEGNISSSVLNLMPIPCVVKDPGNEFRYIRCNRAFASLHHLDPAEMIGRRDVEFYADGSLAVIRRTDAEAMAKHEMIHFEDTCLWGDCNRRVFLYWKLPMTLKDGRTLLFCVAQDVTEIKQKINTEHFHNEINSFLLGHSEPEELLDFVAKRLIETLGCQHVLLHRHDGTRQDWFPDNEHTYCNKCVDCPLKTADPELFCHNGNVVLNDANISDFPLPENCPTRILIARRILFEGDEWGKIGTLFTGDAFESLGFCEELLEQVANVVSVCIERKARNTVIKRQNEEVVRINRQLQLARDRAVAAENARSYFFSCISHDVRTPLNAIIGYAELLKKGIRDETERAGAYDAITMSGRSLLQIVNDMIDLARLESETLVIEPVPTDLNGIAAKVLRSFDIAVAGKPVTLRGEWDDDLPYLEIDPKRMWQILFNLLDNAVKFTENGEIVLKLAFAREKDSGRGILSVAVSDTGSGMSEEEQKRVMQPFASPSEKGRHEIGAGLGVTICRHLVDRMHGSMELRSEPGRGSVFDIRIPDIKFSERTNSFPRPGSLIDFHGKTREALRVLIVDDVPLNISVLRAMLRKNGVNDIVCSVNGRDALARIRADVAGFDLVLTDLWMPEMDGRKMLQELRSDTRFKSLNVIAITADVDAKDECMKLGFSDVIFKPVTLARIVNFLPPPSDAQRK